MSRYKQSIIRIAEENKDYDYSELPDSEPYIELGLIYAITNPKHFLLWLNANPQHNRDEILFEALNSLAKTYLKESIITPDFDDTVYEYAKQNTIIEADYELAREEAVKYDLQDGGIDPDEPWSIGE